MTTPPTLPPGHPSIRLEGPAYQALRSILDRGRVVDLSPGALLRLGKRHKVFAADLAKAAGAMARVGECEITAIPGTDWKFLSLAEPAPTPEP